MCRDIKGRHFLTNKEEERVYEYYLSADPNEK